MFTGIVEALGEVVELRRTGDAGVLAVRAPEVVSDLAAGGSVAVDGCCLTVLEHPRRDGSFRVDVMGETLARTTIGGLAPGDRVNLERPVPASGRMDGHLVQGHVDGSGVVLARDSEASWDLVRIAVPKELSSYLASKGSVAVDGVSLTVVEVADPPAREPWFTVGLIPTTLQRTTLGRRQPGAHVNLEVDVIAKYVERLVATRPELSRA